MCDSYLLFSQFVFIPENQWEFANGKNPVYARNVTKTFSYFELSRKCPFNSLCSACYPMHCQGEPVVLTEVKSRGNKVVTVFAEGTEIDLQDKITEIKSRECNMAAVLLNLMTRSFKTAEDEDV